MADLVSLVVQYSTDDGDTYTPITDVEGVNVTMGIDQDTAVASVELSSLPSGLEHQHRLIIDAGWNGSTALIFNGLVSGIGGRLSSRSWSLKNQCFMARLRHPWGNGYFDYSAQTDAAIITNLIEKSGIDPSLHSIQSSGWSPEYVELRDGTADSGGEGVADVPLQIIRELDKVALHWTATRGNGAIYRRPIAYDTPYATYTQGSAPLRDFEWEEDVEGILNKWLVKGLTIAAGLAVEAEASATNSYLPTPVEYNSETLQSNYIDDTTIMAQDVADDYLALYNHRPWRATLTLDGDSAIEIGYTVRVTSSFFGLTNKQIFVQRVEHRIAGSDFVTTISGIALA